MSIVLIGGGGHCVSCIEVLESTSQWAIAGIVDGIEKLDTKLLDYRYVGTDDDLSSLIREHRNVLVTVGQIASADTRRRIFTTALAAGAAFPVIVASTARVSPRAEIGDGTIVLHGAFVNAGAKVGINCIVNTGAIIEHDAKVGDYCHVSTAAVVNGDCVIGEGSFVGSGAVLRNGIRVAPGCVIGAGAAVTSDLDTAGTYVGCPARRLR